MKDIIHYRTHYRDADRIGVFLGQFFVAENTAVCSFPEETKLLY